MGYLFLHICRTFHFVLNVVSTVHRFFVHYAQDEAMVNSYWVDDEVEYRVASQT